MGTIYKVSKPLPNTGNNAYHDYLLYVRDDGTVRILRGGPAKGSTFYSWIFGNIQTVETDYGPDDSTAATIKYSDEFYGAKDWNPDAVNPDTGQWDPNLETRPMEVVYQGADSDFLWGLGADWVLDFDANRNVAYWPTLQNSNSVTTTALINMGLTNPTMDYAPRTLGSPADDVNLDELPDYIEASSVDHLLFYTDVNPVNVPDGYFYGPDGNLYRIIQNTPNLISFDRSLPGNVGGIDYRIRMKFEIDDGLISNAYSDIIAHDPVDGDQEINSVHAVQNSDGSVSFTEETLVAGFNSATGMHEITVTARPLDLIQEAPPGSQRSIQQQNLSFDANGLLTSFETSFYEAGDLTLTNPLALASFSLGADNLLQGGFTEINGLQLDLDVQAMLDDLDFNPSFIGDEAVTSAMESFGASPDLINQFNDWALRNGDPSMLVIDADVDTSNWSATLTSVDGSSSKTLTPTVDATGQINDFELVFIDGFPVTIESGLEGASREFEIERQYKIQKDAANNWGREKINEQYRFDTLLVEAGVVGSMFGSSLSSLVTTNNALERVAVSTVFGLVGKELFQFSAAAINGKTLGESLDAALGDIGVDLKNAGKGAISAFLTAELFNALSMDGVAGEVANTAGGAVISAVVENFDNIANGTISFGDAINGTTLPDGTPLQGIQFGNIFGSYLGAKLASEVIGFDTVGGQIGASLGAGATSFFAGKAIGNGLTSLFGNLGAFGGPLGFAVGAFLGYIAGGLFGSLFGGTPRSGADVTFDPATGEFDVNNVWAKKGGSKEAAEGLATAAAEALNGVLGLIGGEVANEGRVSGGSYGLRKSDYTYRVDGGAFGPGDPGKRTIARTFDGDEEDAAAQLIEHGVLNALDDLRIAGGDVYLKRALYNSLDSLLLGDDVPAGLEGEALGALYGNLATAGDYKTYVENAANDNGPVNRRWPGEVAA